MRASIKFVICLLLSAANVASGARCNADNCARAVTGTAKGSARVTSAKDDCSSFLRQTVVLTLSTTTITVPPSAASVSLQLSAAQSKTVPVYASACSGDVRYSSACSCFGVTADTTTLASSTTTVTISATVSQSGSTFSTSISPSGSSSSTSASASSSGPASIIPTSYADCILDPSSPATFDLLDANNAIPVVDNNGIASLATAVIDNLDHFHFSKPANAPAGVYDIVLESKGQAFYFAIFSTGKVGFTSTSSNGQAYVTAGDGSKYVTSVFSVGCNAKVTAGIIGGPEFTFEIVGNNVVVENAPPSTKRRRDIPVPEGFYVSPTEPPPITNSGTRCANPSQTAVTKNPPPPLTSNGCGTDTGIGYFVPNLNFVSACNMHDVCYDTCSESFDDCNVQFLNNNLMICHTDFAAGSLLGWACEKAANLYGWAVTTSVGKQAFADATTVYCDCDCKDPALTACGGDCIDILTDPKNCGHCDFVCPSGGCTNGACSFNSCTGQTCSTFGSCGPGGSCVCASITDHTGFCVNGETPCDGLASCETSADCGLGSVCAVGTCCDGNVCITTDACGGFSTPPAMFAMGKRAWVNGTIAHPGVWV